MTAGESKLKKKRRR